ncbi:MAG: LysR substrate-binding domain-containing protein [Woeseiaceae bacterium]|nr:LysR substrate-binding domain-containing protein [Woeseiaceae bacterium]
MYDMPLNALRALVAVREAGGIRPAARRLGVSHSSVSRHLREIEKWLGTPLFESRDGARSLEFTAQGEALARASLESLKSLSRAVDAARESRRRNSVILTTTPSVAALWLLPRLPSFQQGYPWVEVSVIAKQRIVDLNNDDADIAIRMGKGPWPGLHCEAFMDDELFPVLGRDLWQKSGKPSDPEQVAEYTLLHDRDPQTPWSAWLDEYVSGKVDARKGPRFDSSDLVLRAAAQGLGMALARARLVADELESGRLVKPFGERHVKLPDAYWIVCAKSTLQRAAIAPVITWLKSQARRVRTELPAGSGRD